MTFEARTPTRTDLGSVLAAGLVTVVLGAPVVTAVSYGVGDAAVVLLVVLGIVAMMSAAIAL